MLSEQYRLETDIRTVAEWVLTPGGRSDSPVKLAAKRLLNELELHGGDERTADGNA